MLTWVSCPARDYVELSHLATEHCPLQERKGGREGGREGKMGVRVGKERDKEGEGEREREGQKGEGERKKGKEREGRRDCRELKVSLSMHWFSGGMNAMCGSADKPLVQ